MTRLHPGALFVAILAGCTRTAEPSTSSADSDTPAPIELSAAEVHRQLPPICTDGRTHIADEFEIVNDTHQPVDIREVGRTCSCTVPNLHKTSLAPGERTRVAAKVNTPRTLGHWSYTVNVIMTNGRACRVITSTYLYRAIAADRDVVSWIDLRAGEPHTSRVQVDVHRPADSPERPLSAVAKNGRVGVEVQNLPDSTVSGIVRQAYSINLTVTPDDQHPTGDDEIELSLGGEGEPVSTAVRVNWRCVTPFVVTPARAVVVVKPSAATGTSQRVVIKCSLGAFTPTLDKANPEKPTGVSVAFQATASPTTWVTEISADPGKVPAGTRRFDLRIATGRPDQPLLALPVTLFAE